MKNIEFKIITHESQEYDDAFTLKERILRIPDNLKFAESEILADKDLIHFVGLNGDEIVATAALVPKLPHCRVQRVAIKEDLVKLGIGSKLMAFVEEYAKKQGFKSIYCSVRDSAIIFYTKAGYKIEGEFLAEDLPCDLKMRKLLY